MSRNFKTDLFQEISDLQEELRKVKVRDVYALKFKHMKAREFNV